MKAQAPSEEDQAFGLTLTAAGCVGAMLYRGTRLGKSGRPNIPAREVQQENAM